MTGDEYVAALIHHAKEVRESHGMIVRIILSLNRSRLTSKEAGAAEFDQITRMATAHPNYIVGIDISGSPHLGDLNYVLPQLRDVLASSSPWYNKLKLTVHIAEVG
eukprot:GHVN01055941.1.p1 GENE.GHVN01055941.1~~GHVN01055941.1.p1  ORF type:complete len:106 (+),score=13.08 GHVN01055941.1:374-691(+)